jgi:soluble lytic murein transglycosylase-like protein
MNIWAIVFIVFLVAYIILSGWLFKTQTLKVWGKPEAVEDKHPPYGRAILEAYYETGAPADLLTRLLLSESGLDPTAKGGTNADGSRDHGIAQLNGRYLAYFAEKYSPGGLDPYDPLQAIPVMARYLADLHKLFDCWACAVGAYKHGPTAWTGKLGNDLVGIWLYEEIGGEHTHKRGTK